MDWEKLFCDVDDFCLVAEPLLWQRLLADGRRRRNRRGRLTASESRPSVNNTSQANGVNSVMPTAAAAMSTRMGQ